MLKSIDEDLVIEHTLIISFLFFFDLTQEKIFLDEGIVEFRIGIAEFVIFDEKFEPLGESWFRSVIFGQG